MVVALGVFHFVVVLDQGWLSIRGRGKAWGLESGLGCARDKIGIEPQ